MVLSHCVAWLRCYLCTLSCPYNGGFRDVHYLTTWIDSVTADYNVRNSDTFSESSLLLSIISSHVQLRGPYVSVLMLRLYVLDVKAGLCYAFGFNFVIPSISVPFTVWKVAL